VNSSLFPTVRRRSPHAFTYTTCCAASPQPGY